MTTPKSEFERELEKCMGECDRLAKRYKQIELANKEWSRNDAVAFGDLYEKIRALEIETQVKDINWQAVTKQNAQLRMLLNELVKTYDDYFDKGVDGWKGTWPKHVDAIYKARAMLNAKESERE